MKLNKNVVKAIRYTGLFLVIVAALVFGLSTFAAPVVVVVMFIDSGLFEFLRAEFGLFWASQFAFDSITGSCLWWIFVAKALYKWFGKAIPMANM